MRTVGRRTWSRLRAARAALLAAGVSYYLIASVLPILVLVSAAGGFVSRYRTDVVSEIVTALNVSGETELLITTAVGHAQDSYITSSVIGLLGLLWVALSLTGALRRAVDAVWSLPDIGWSARLRSLPWAVVAAVLIVGSLTSTALAVWAGPATGAVAAALGLGLSACFAAWFLARLGSARPCRRALLTTTVLLTTGLEVAKYAAGFALPRLISHDSLIYGSLGSALALLVVALVVSWLLLTATSLAAELSADPIAAHAGITMARAQREGAVTVPVLRDPTDLARRYPSPEVEAPHQTD